MRSLVAEIFQSLSRNSFLVSSANSSSCGPISTRIGASAIAVSSIRRSAAPLAGAVCNSSPALQRARIGTAEAGARIDGEATEHRFARDAALDREIAERAATGKAQRQRLAVRERHRRIDGHGAPGDVGVARGARQRDANRAVTRGKRRAERADLDGRREWLVSDQCVGRRKRQTVHRAARRQAIALRAVPAAILHRTGRAD